MIQIEVNIVTQPIQIEINLDRKIGDTLSGIEDTIDANGTFIIEDDLS